MARLMAPIAMRRPPTFRVIILLILLSLDCTSIPPTETCVRHTIRFANCNTREYSASPLKRLTATDSCPRQHSIREPKVINTVCGVTYWRLSEKVLKAQCPTNLPTQSSPIHALGSHLTHCTTVPPNASRPTAREINRSSQQISLPSSTNHSHPSRNEHQDLKVTPPPRSAPAPYPPDSGQVPPRGRKTKNNGRQLYTGEGSHAPPPPPFPTWPITSTPNPPDSRTLQKLWTPPTEPLASYVGLEKTGTATAARQIKEPPHFLPPATCHSPLLCGTPAWPWDTVADPFLDESCSGQFTAPPATRASSELFRHFHQFRSWIPQVRPATWPWVKKADPNLDEPVLEDGALVLPKPWDLSDSVGAGQYSPAANSDEIFCTFHTKTLPPRLKPMCLQLSCVSQNHGTPKSALPRGSLGRQTRTQALWLSLQVFWHSHAGNNNIPSRATANFLDKTLPSRALPINAGSPGHIPSVDFPVRAFDTITAGSCRFFQISHAVAEKRCATVRQRIVVPHQTARSYPTRRNPSRISPHLFASLRMLHAVTSVVLRLAGQIAPLMAAAATWVMVHAAVLLGTLSPRENVRIKHFIIIKLITLLNQMIWSLLIASELILLVGLSIRLFIRIILDILTDIAFVLIALLGLGITIATQCIEKTTHLTPHGRRHWLTQALFPSANPLYECRELTLLTKYLQDKAPGTSILLLQLTGLALVAAAQAMEIILGLTRQGRGKQHWMGQCLSLNLVQGTDQLNLISWNLRHLLPKGEEGIPSLLSTYKPHILFLQETHLKQKHRKENLRIPLEYRSIWSSSKTGLGGVGLLYPANWHADSNTTKYATPPGLAGYFVRLRLKGPTPVTLLNMYLPVDDKDKRNAIWAAVKAAMDENPTDRVWIGGDFNGVTETTDRNSGVLKGRDRELQAHILDLKLLRPPRANSTHTWTGPTATARLDGWLSRHSSNAIENIIPCPLLPVRPPASRTIRPGRRSTLRPP